MSATTLLVKNMVCHRCILAVENILTAKSISFLKVNLGEIHFGHEILEDQKEQLGKNLCLLGFELIDNPKTFIIKKIKQLVLKRARNEVVDGENQSKLSLFISNSVNHEYTYLSSLFSSVEGRTIENYFIEQRIEKVKELLIYGQMPLSQIAFELDYSSVAYLSSQFRRITGFNPSSFKLTVTSKRNLLSHI